MTGDAIATATGNDGHWKISTTTDKTIQIGAKTYAKLKKDATPRPNHHFNGDGVEDDMVSFSWCCGLVAFKSCLPAPAVFFRPDDGVDGQDNPFDFVGYRQIDLVIGYRS
mmetsp:Transcript_4988/g.12658  ORF Transcript_4988/g.12658 Transcript_4988/m.12658 type:complete len:110 (+) Transcript_4988:1185-1514(+)